MLPGVGRSLGSKFGFWKDEAPSPGYDTDTTSTANNAGIVGYEFHDLATKKHESVARDAKVENTSGDRGKPAHAGKCDERAASGVDLKLSSGEKSGEVKESAPPPAPPLRDAPAPAEDIKPAAVSVPEPVPATQESVAEKESASHEAPPADVQDTSAAVAADGQSTAEQNGLTDTSTTDPSAAAAETSAEPAKPTQEPSAPAAQPDTTTAAAADLFNRVPTEPGDVGPWDFGTGPVDVNPAPPADPQEDLLADAVLVQTSDAVAAPADPVPAATASVKPTTTLSVETGVPPVRQLRDSSVQTAIDESSSFAHGAGRILTPRSASAQHASAQSQAANPIVRTLSTGKDAGVQSAVEPGDDAKRFAETVAKSAPAESDNSNTTEKKKTAEGVKADAETTVDGTAASGVPESTAKDEAKTDASAQPAATAAQPEGQAQDDGKAAKPTLHVDTGNAADEPPAVPPKEEGAAAPAAAGAEPEAEAASSLPKHMQDADDASTEGGDGTSRSASPVAPKTKKPKKRKARQG